MSITLFWLTIGSPILFFVDSAIVRSLLALIAVGVTFLLLRMRTLTQEMVDSGKAVDS